MKQLQAQVLSLIQQKDDEKFQRSPWRNNTSSPYKKNQWPPNKQDNSRRDHDDDSRFHTSRRDHQSPSSMKQYHNGQKRFESVQQESKQSQNKASYVGDSPREKYSPNRRHQKGYYNSPSKKRVFSAMADDEDLPNELYDKHGQLVCTMNQEEDEDEEPTDQKESTDWFDK